MRRYHVTTFGCQMNAHDSERIKGLLESAGLGEAASAADADVIVFNTCTIREKADGRFLQHLMNAHALKQRDPSKRIVVGGCFAESMRDEMFDAYPFVDFAFGPGAVHQLDQAVAPTLPDRRGHFGTFDAFAADLPRRRERPFQAWLQISMGCNSVCSYCIVPAVRGRERSRPWQSLISEAEALVADGVKELTLLGQNVNSYGRDLPLQQRIGFADLLRTLDRLPGLERVRYTSPHPKDMRADVLEALAECRVCCEHMHLPLQSGSSRMLKLMRRTYDQERYLRLVERVRSAIPTIALTTDIIVGFPGETDEDFQATLDVYDAVGFDHAFTFIYSPRRGTEAASMPDHVPDQVKHARLAQLVEVVQRHARVANRARIGNTVEVLVEGPSRTDPGLVRGRSRQNTTVLVEATAAPGAIIPVRVVEATSQTLRGVPAPARAA